jgi:hypothetical protein
MTRASFKGSSALKRASRWAAAGFWDTVIGCSTPDRGPVRMWPGVCVQGRAINLTLEALAWPGQGQLLATLENSRSRP